MNATELSQIIVEPDDVAGLTKSERLWIASQADQQDPWWPSLKVQVGWILHPFGIHTWVRWRHYDAASDSILEMGTICTWCPKARLG